MITQVHSESLPLPAAFPVRLFSVAEYHRLAEVGVLTQDDRVELLEGVISPKIVHSPIHDATVSVVEQLLRARLLPGWFLRVQSSISLPTSEPEPDIAIVKGPPSRYTQAHPAGQDIALVVEVAESSLSRDHRKAMTYADGHIRCYWIINLQSRTLEVYDRPDQGLYSRQRILKASEMPECIDALDPDVPLTVGDLFV
ncbi:MAG: Uma2 family endonuclease [Planctomycetaceae bacterium]